MNDTRCKGCGRGWWRYEDDEKYCECGERRPAPPPPPGPQLPGQMSLDESVA